MLILTQLKSGVAFELEGTPYVVVSSQHTKIGRGGAILRAKIKNLLTGAIFDRTFKGSENFQDVDLERKKAQFLYKEGGDYFFMDNADFNQFSLSKQNLGATANFLVDGANVEIIYYEDKPISVKLPIKIELKVTYTEPGFKGNTASATNKPAKLESGAEIQVPLFINIGDIIRVNTETGQYVERA